jgi:hypothetical protein
MPVPLKDALVAPYASGFSLDALANTHQVFRLYGETDAQLRERVLGPEVVRTVEEDE